MLYVPMDDASSQSSLCVACRNGSVPVVEDTPKRSGLFSRSKSVTAGAGLPKLDGQASRSESVSALATARSTGRTESPPEGDLDFSQMEIVRGGNTDPTFTADGEKPKYKFIVPIVVILMVAGLALGAFLIREPTRLPATPAGERTAWLIDAMNDSRAVDVSAIHANFSASVIQESGDTTLLAQIREWDQRHSAYVVERIVDGDDRHRLVALITTEAMDWGELIVEVEDDDPHLIRSFSIGPGERPR